MSNNNSENGIKLFLCGDVMTGRGIDQIFPNSVNPRIYESYVKDACDYVTLTERENGPIKQPVSYSYIWGDALGEWEKVNPDFKIINLETAVTEHDDPWPGKGINYRMHPENVHALTAAGIDFCTLANNHILDWEYDGLGETVQTLENAGISSAGAGKDLQSSTEPAILERGKNRVIIFSYGSPTSGVPAVWAAETDRPGVNFLRNLNDKSVEKIKKQIESIKQPGDIIVFSVHWGENWGYDIPKRQREFAHKLIDEAGVDLIHGHSSHHFKGIEVYEDKLIIYGAGDFINDYEGIGGHEKYRDDLTLMYFPTINPENGTLISVKIVPLQIKNFKLNYTTKNDVKWIQKILNREGKTLGTSVKLNDAGDFWLQW